MKQRKEFEKKEPTKERKGSQKSVQELVNQINHLISKDSRKAAFVVESWVNSAEKTKKKAS